MSINVSGECVQVLDVAIRRINFLTNPLIFNGPFDNSTTTVLIDCLKYELENLELLIDASIEKLVGDCFVCFINRFNTLQTCCHLTFCFSQNQKPVSQLYKRWRKRSSMLFKIRLKEKTTLGFHITELLQV